MSDKPYQPWHRYTDALSASAELLQEDSGKSLRLLDDAIALAISEKENQWALALSHHAAVISTFLGETDLVKHYYQQSLSFSPENPPALLTGPSFCTTASERVYITTSSGNANGGSQGAVGDRRAAICGANAAGAGGL